MGQPIKHQLSGLQGWMENKWYAYVHYGKCMRPPYSESGLWYVTIPSGKGGDGNHEIYKPDQEHTFIIEPKHANPNTIELFRRDVELWSGVAQKVFIGKWCDYYECLWKDTPVFALTLANKVRVKYGYNRTQPYEENYMDRELWYVAFEDGPTFVVDHICATEEFITKLGSNYAKWEQICWCRLEQEVNWMTLGREEDNSFVRHMSGFALDSPYRPASLERIPKILRAYELRTIRSQQNTYGTKESTSHIFISYSHKDTVYAHELAEEMNEQGFNAWIDDRIKTGELWEQVLRKQIDTCSAFIVIMTPRSYSSEWVQIELSHAQEKRKPIVPLLLEGETWHSVAAIQHLDVRENQLPPIEFYEILLSKLGQANPGFFFRAYTRIVTFFRGSME